MASAQPAWHRGLLQIRSSRTRGREAGSRTRSPSAVLGGVDHRAVRRRDPPGHRWGATGATCGRRKSPRQRLTAERGDEHPAGGQWQQLSLPGTAGCFRSGHRGLEFGSWQPRWEDCPVPLLCLFCPQDQRPRGRQQDEEPKRRKRSRRRSHSSDSGSSSEELKDTSASSGRLWLAGSRQGQEPVPRAPASSRTVSPASQESKLRRGGAAT